MVSAGPAGKRKAVLPRGGRYLAIKRALMERIAAGQYSQSLPVPSDKVLAGELGVSPMTAWRAIQELVMEGVLVRQAGRGKGTFVRMGASSAPNNRSASQLQRLGVLHAQHWEAMQANPVHFITFLEIQAECARRGIGLEFLPVPAETDPAAAVRLVRDSACQAVIVLSWARESIPLAVRDAGIPVVIAGHYGPSEPLSFVSPNNFQGGHVITSHLLALGHSDVGIINGGRANSVSAEREAGWLAALSESSAADAFVYRIDLPNASLDQLRCRLRELFRERPAPTALFARDGLTASAAILALRELGRECPRDASIACVGKFYEGAMHMPHMTAAVTDDGAVARGVLRLIEDMVTGRQDGPAGLLLPMHVVEGATTLRVQ